MQKSFEWSEHPFWEIRGNALTSYIGTCKGHLTNQNIFIEKSKTLHSHPMLVHTKIIWLIKTPFLRNQRGTALTYYIGTCKGHLTNRNILLEKSEALHWLAILEHAKVIWLLRTFFLRIKGTTTLTGYVGTCKDHLTNQNIFSEKSKALYSHPMLEYAKVIWLIRTSFLRNQKALHSLAILEYLEVIWLVSNKIDNYIKNTY